MKLLKWLIKMAKKLLNLNTENGVQSWEDGSALPEGTANQTLRHNGTEWVATNKIYVSTDNRDENDRISIYDAFGNSSISIVSKCGDEPIPEQVFPENYHISSIVVGADTQESSVTITAEKIRLSLPDNYLKPIGSVLKLKNSEGEIEWGDVDALTKTKIINRVLTSASSIHSFDNTDLGITGDLTTKIFSFELLRKINGNDYFSLGELVQTEKTLTSSAVTFATGEIPSGDTIRLAITYID